MLDILLPLLQGVFVTAGVTLGALLIGAILGAPLAALRMSRNRVASFAAAAFINIVRGVPGLLWLFIVFYGLGSSVVRIDPVPTAVLVLGAVATVQLAEVYRGGLLSVPLGQSEASQVLGFGRAQTFALVQLPQALLAALPAGATVAINLLKESAMASIIGVQDIAARAVSSALRSTDDIPIYLGAALLYIALSVPVALLARWVHGVLERRVHVR